jgi:hypothetical protein
MKRTDTIKRFCSFSDQDDPASNDCDHKTKIEKFCSFCNHFDQENCDCQLIDGLSRDTQAAGLCTRAHIAGYSVEMRQTTIEASSVNGDDLTIHKCHYRGNRDGIIRRLEKGR